MDSGFGPSRGRPGMTGCLNRRDEGACTFSVHSRESGNPALTHNWVPAVAGTNGDKQPAIPSRLPNTPLSHSRIVAGAVLAHGRRPFATDSVMTSLTPLAFIAAIFLLAGFVKGVIGMGLPTVAVGLLGLTMPPSQAAAVLILPSLVTNVWQAFAGGHFRDVARRLWPMLVGICIGTWFGAMAVPDAK